MKGFDEGDTHKALMIRAEQGTMDLSRVRSESARTWAITGLLRECFMSGNLGSYV